MCFCFVVSVVRVFSKSKPTQSKRQTQWQVWIWAVSSLRSPIQSNPNLFVNIFCVYRNRRSWSSTHRCRFGSRVRSCSGVNNFNIFEPNSHRNSVDFESSLGTHEPERVPIRCENKMFTAKDLDFNPLPSHCSFIEDVYPWSLSPSKWAVLVVKLTYKNGEVIWAKNSAEEPAKAFYYIRIVSKVIRIY